MLHGIYKIMDDEGQIKECEIERSVEECIRKQDVISPLLSSALPLIVVSGLLDGISLYAFSVLLFFTALARAK